MYIALSSMDIFSTHIVFLLLCIDSFCLSLTPPLRRIQTESGFQTDDPTPLPLRIDWSNGRLFSSLAQRINASQHRCEGVIFHHMRNYGMGSDLHTWSQALANAMEVNQSLLQRPEPWVWRSRHFCRNAPSLPLQCYFQFNNTCPVTPSQVCTSKLSHNDSLNTSILN
jgi:hypothetical protein